MPATRTAELLTRVEASLGMIATAGTQRIRELEHRLSDSERKNQQLELRVGDAEAAAHGCTHLYVALHQIHTTLDPQTLQARVLEVVVELLGARAFAVIGRAPDRNVHPVLFGAELGRSGRFGLTRTDYLGGHDGIDRALEEGVGCIGRQEGPCAIMPLVIEGGAPVGALVLLELLPHRAQLTSRDLDALDVFAQHLATALVAVGLVRGERGAFSTA